MGICKCRFDHDSASNICPRRKKTKSFLWSIVRDPTTRTISNFYFFKVMRGGVEPTAENFIGSTSVKSAPEQYLRMMSPEKYVYRGYSPRSRLRAVNRILDEYDFLAVTERMDESAVALSMLMGIPLADVMYLPSKIHGVSFDIRSECRQVQPSHVTPKMQEFLDSDEWKRMSKWDRVIHKAANRNLDLTIERLGQFEFQKKLALFKQAQDLALERCLHGGLVTLPCSDGVPHRNNETDCMWRDSACGMRCLDQVATELNLW